MSPDLLEAVKLSEGFRDKVYKCTEGYDTIGYGFAIKDLVMDEDIAEIILRRKLDKLIDKANNKFNFLKRMPHKIQDVIYEMCYQMGVTGVSKFKKASIEMLDSRWARQTPNRARKLSNIVKNVSR